MYKVMTFLKAMVTLKIFYNSVSLKMWEAIAPAGRKAHNSVQDDDSSFVVFGHHRQLIFPITRDKYKAVQSTSIQRHKGLAKSP